ncbi:hypothetical protein ACLK1T_16765 [Escherichia coli]
MVVLPGCTEVPEMFGAEQLLMDHCRDEATFEKTGHHGQRLQTVLYCP